MSNTKNSSSQNDRTLRSNEFDSQDELSLDDVINFVQVNYRYVIGGILLGAIIAFALAFFLPKQYEAKALIKIGQIGNIDRIVLPIEPALQVVDRIKSQSFQDAVLRAIGVSTESDDDQLAGQFKKNLNVKLEKSELISLNLKAFSRTEAEIIMLQVVNQLNFTHNILMKPTVWRLKAELDSINEELKIAEIESKQLLKALEMQSDKNTDTKFSQTVLLNSLRISKDQEFRALKDTKRLLEEKLSPERTFATHILGNVEVSKKPVFPKYGLFIAAGMFIGLMISLLYIAIKNSIIKSPKIT